MKWNWFWQRGTESTFYYLFNMFQLVQLASKDKTLCLLHTQLSLPWKNAITCPSFTELYLWRVEHNFSRSRQLQSILYLLWNSSCASWGSWSPSGKGSGPDINRFFQQLGCCCREEHLLTAQEGHITMVPMPEIKWQWYTNVSISRYKWRCHLKLASRDWNETNFKFK